MNLEINLSKAIKRRVYSVECFVVATIVQS